ncbi:hypothetical protein [Natronomonas sp.]
MRERCGFLDSTRGLLSLWRPAPRIRKRTVLFVLAVLLVVLASWGYVYGP